MCAAIALLAGCVATGRSTSPLPGSESPAFQRTAPRNEGTLTIRVHIPSPATKGLVLAFNPYFGTFAFNLTRINRRECSGTPLVCTIAVTLPAHGYNPTISTYDQAPINGVIPAGATLLSSARNVPLIVTRRATEPIDLILGGIMQRFAVPTGVAEITITAAGGQGGGVAGGEGGSLTASIPVKPGETLTAVAGAAGGDPQGGFKGGGDGGGGGGGFYGGGGGGGASDVRQAGVALSNRVLVAGGGGGGGGYADSTVGFGGTGGGSTGGHGGIGLGGGHGYPGYGGGGGTQTAGGAGGTSVYKDGSAGALGAGGHGGRGSYEGGGGGGGGYYGGGGGGAGHIEGGGGGGGSAFVESSATKVTMAQGVQIGYGLVFISW